MTGLWIDCHWVLRGYDEVEAVVEVTSRSHDGVWVMVILMALVKVVFAAKAPWMEDFEGRMVVVWTLTLW